MRFHPKTDEEIQLSSLLPEGLYHYQVINSEDKPNKTNGNIYTSITLKVWDGANQEHLIFTNMALMKLLKHFCDVNDMQNSYNSGDIPAELFLNKSGGKVLLGVEKEKPDGKGGMYKAKNIVKDYVKNSDPAIKPSSLMPLAPKNEFTDDEIPF